MNNDFSLESLKCSLLTNKILRQIRIFVINWGVKIIALVKISTTKCSTTTKFFPTMKLGGPKFRFPMQNYQFRIDVCRCCVFVLYLVDYRDQV